MIGIFDSGVGGFAALSKLRELRPRVDVAYLADRKNAPYGTKSISELERLVLRDIDILRAMGAEKILAACCTACSVIDRLDTTLTKGVTTIIKPAARAAVKKTENGKIAVICTDATAKSQAFESELKRLMPDIEVKTKPSARLVELAECGARDSRLDKSELDIIRSELSPLLDFGADTVILGCTHFSLLKHSISGCLNADFVSAADEGASLLAASLKNEGVGGITYTCPEKLSVFSV